MKPEIRRLVVVVGVTTLSGCGSGGDDGSGPTVAVSAQSRAATPEVIGVFSGYGGVFSFDTAGGDGAVGGGGDGEGGVGAGGSLGRFARAQVTVLLDDGKVLGPAFTDDRGLVTIKPGKDYKGGLKVELVGVPGTSYFDESTVGDLVFPAGERLRVHVDKNRGNIGITPLTEAAVPLQDDPA